MRIVADWWCRVPLSDTAKTYIEGLAVGLIGLALLQVLFRALAWWAVMVG